MVESVEGKLLCPVCGAKYRWKPELAGRKVKCKCESILRLPKEAGGEITTVEVRTPQTQATAAAAPPPPPPAATESEQIDVGSLGDAGTPKDAYDLDLPADDLAAATPAPPQTNLPGRCPSCGVAIKPGAVICVNCGFNLAEGKKVQTQIAESAGDDEPAPGRPKPKTPLYGGGTSAVAKAIEKHEDEAGPNRMIDLYIPLALMLLGLGFSFWNKYGNEWSGTQGELLKSLLMVGVELALVVPFMLFALVVSANLMGISFGPLGPGLIKIVAVSFGPGALGYLIGALIFGEGMGGVLFGFVLSLVLYWILMTVLFEIEALEALQVITIIVLLRNLAIGFLLGLVQGFFH